MAITLEDLQVIRNELDKEYVKVVDCNDIQADNNDKFSKNATNIAITSHDVHMMKKLLLIGVSTGISSVVIAFLELILK